MQLQELELKDVLECAALSIKIDDKEGRPRVDPQLLERGLLEGEECFLMIAES